MLKLYIHLLSAAFFLWLNQASAQLQLSEVCQTNMNVLADEDGDYSDWLELFNNSTEAIDLSAFALSDNTQTPAEWPLPAVTLQAGQRLLVWADGKNRNGVINHFEIPILPNSNWQYTVPNATTPDNWRATDFDASSWSVGQGGFGYGDGDDNTVIDPTNAVFMRTTITLSNPSEIALFYLLMDYDDAFVAYLNGIEIARANIGLAGDAPPAFDQPANSAREAVGYSGGDYEGFNIPQSIFQSAFVVGENVLAIQVHNVSADDDDLSALSLFLLGMTGPTVQTNLPPPNLPMPVQLLAPHASFKLTTGETAVLATISGTIIDQVIVAENQTDHSYARTAGGWCFTDTPTPGTANSTNCFSDVIGKPVFLTDAGIYEGSVEVSIVSPDLQSEIRYTTDGSIPTATSPLYTAPLEVSSTAVISARCFGNGLPSAVEKNTYLINEWGLGLPVISITTNPENLWDENIGIHVFGPPDYDPNYPHWGANFWENWERLSYIEYFHPQEGQKFEGNMGLKIHGGWSRASPQKSFRLKFRDEYGLAEVQYPLIADKPEVTSFKGFNLRNGGNAYWDYRFHDALMQRATKGTHTDYMGYSPVIVFLNGTYWGFMEVREIMDEDWAASNRGVPTDASTVISYNYMGFNVINGDASPFNDMFETIMAADPATDAFFDTVAHYIDIENYVDYIITQTYWANGDWSNGWLNNTKFWHDDRPGGKWRFMLMDLDFGMGLAGASPTDNYISTAGDEWYFTDQIFGRIITNTRFRNYFINRYADLMNTTFQPTRVNAMAEEMRQEVAQVFERHAAFIGTDPGVLYWGLDGRLGWNNARLQGARDVVQNHFSLPDQVNITLDVQPAGAGRIHISTLTPEEAEYPWTGVYFDGVPVRITAIANDGYTFSHWGENALFGNPLPFVSTELIMATDLTFVAFFEETNSSPQVIVSEVMYHPDDARGSGEWIELYNRSNAPADLSLFTLRDANPWNRFTLPAGTVLGGHQYIVIAQNEAAFRAAYPEVNNVLGSFSFGFSNNSDSLILENREGQMVASLLYSDSAPWPIAADGTGRSLERLLYGQSAQNATNWMNGCIGGSPGGPHIACDAALVVSEINYRSASSANAGDWIELHNTTSQALPLSGYRIDARQGASIELPANVEIAPYGYVVFAASEELFSNVHPQTSFVNTAGWSLLDAGDVLTVRDANGVSVYSTMYGSSAVWPSAANGGGYTLEMDSTAVDACAPDGWFIGCPQGSPSTPFVNNCGWVFVEETATAIEHPEVLIFPNPANQFTRLVWNENSEATFHIYAMDGREVFTTHAAGETQRWIDTSAWSSGVYSIHTQTAKGTYITKLIVQH